MTKKTVGLISLFLINLAALTVKADEYWYWDTAVDFVGRSAAHPITASGGGLSVVAWQESLKSDNDFEIKLGLATRRASEDWLIRTLEAGPYHYQGAEPPIASLLVDDQANLLLAVAADSSTLEVFSLDGEGQVIYKSSLSSGAESRVTPRLFQDSSGGYLLFSTQGLEESLSLTIARSADGQDWTEFQPFINEENLRLNFLPSHIAYQGREYLVFQSLTTAQQPTFQLYLKFSDDQGKTWSQAKLLTDFTDPEEPQLDFSQFDNQRAHLSIIEEQLMLVWERKSLNASAQIYVGFLNLEAEFTSEPARVNDVRAACANPIGFYYRGEPTVVWFDNRRGQNRVFLGRLGELGWQNYDLSADSGEALFARPLIDAEGLELFWQQGQKTNRIYQIGPDKTAAAPDLQAVNFKPGKAQSQTVATVTWPGYYDPSGVAGFAYSWSSDPSVQPLAVAALLPTVSHLDLKADDDGPWYFSLKALDYAGNWSPASRIEFVRDTTAPGKVHILPLPLDEAGYLKSNDFVFTWTPPPASDLAGYSWSLDYLAPLDYYQILVRENPVDQIFDFQTATAQRFPAAAPSPRLASDVTSVEYENRDNGIWRFQIAAVDEAGNIGRPAAYYFQANKFRPYTSVAYVDSVKEAGGLISLRIVGRGFMAEGSIVSLVLDQDGQAPYDYVFNLADGAYHLESDRSIIGPLLDMVDVGSYRIGLRHSKRGLYFTAPAVTIDESGTVKFGDFSQSWEPASRQVDRRLTLDSVVLVVVSLLVFAVLGLLISIRGFLSVIQERSRIQTQVQALITGDFMPSDKKQGFIEVKKRSGGLRLKLAAFTILLVSIVVVLVSVPLSILLTRTQEQTLLNGLRERSIVLLESLASGARAYLPSQNTLELGILPSQTIAVPEALYATITGYGSGSTVFADYVWATNDPDIASKIHSEEMIPGIYRLDDDLSSQLEAAAQHLNQRAQAEVGALSKGLSELLEEGVKLVLAEDEVELRRRDDIQAAARELESRLTERLSVIAQDIGSFPAFPTTIAGSEDRIFTLYKPIMFRQGTEDIYYRGAVRLAVGIDSIIAEIAAGRIELLQITLIVASVVFVIGIIGALILSALIIRPIKRLVAHVEIIRDTENKASLAGRDIVVKGKDEIAVLGKTINGMTHGLVKAALASRDLTIGKEVQKMFIPLETDTQGRKLTTGKFENQQVEFFGYYEGAKGVSGDYFDYLKLDDRYFAVIKCDVAGKGVPAALIMVEVATLFLNFFKGWQPTVEAMRLERLVYQINDFIEERGFKGRFAAFSLCLFDSINGIARFCNAGDKLVHWYSAAEKRMKVHSLKDSPTAGVFPNDLIEMKGGYSVESIKLGPGDIIFFYTDGIEEAKRKFRDSQFKEIICAEAGQGQPPMHGNHVVGQADEELGTDRVEDILNAVLSQGRYDLVKYHDPEDKILSFDFQSGTGSVEEAIMALVSIEKVFRLYQRPGLTKSDRVIVDRKIDYFLKHYFEQYRHYCLDTLDHPEYAEYMYYTRLEEDEQYDDLTLLGMRKK